MLKPHGLNSNSHAVCMTIFSQSRRLAALSRHQCWWVVVAWCQLWFTQIRLRVDRTDWLSDLLQRPTPSHNSKSDQALATALHESVRLAARLHPLKPACLPKSIVLLGLLRRRGIQAALCLGVNKSEGSSTRALHSHAWVEIFDGPVCERSTVREDFQLVNTRLR